MIFVANVSMPITASLTSYDTLDGARHSQTAPVSI